MAQTPFSMQQGTRWVYTLNNWTEEDYASHQEWEDVKYHVIAKEVGEEGTPHLQAYVVFYKNKRGAYVKKLSPRANWSLAKGSNSEASQYCKKTPSFWEVGVLPRDRAAAGGRERSRWQEAFDLAKKGKFDEIDGDIMLRSFSSIRGIARMYMQPPAGLEECCGVWLWGDPGLGKSFTARKVYPQYFDKPCNKWWDGWLPEEHDTALLDDFGLEHKVLAHHLKRWADSYAFTAETKGSAASYRPRRLVVTSNYDVDQIFDDHQTILAIQRRFRVVRFTALGVWEGSWPDGDKWKASQEVPAPIAASQDTALTQTQQASPDALLDWLADAGL